MPEFESDQTALAAYNRDFATTCWSVVLAAGQSTDSRSTAALDRLCRDYWSPLYFYVRRRVTDVAEAQDLTQAFFERLLEKRYLASADPDRGRFRAFLLTAFKHFLSKEWDKARAQKRGGNRLHFALHFPDANAEYDLEPHHELTAETIYERRWLLSVLDRVLKQLEQECAGQGKRDHFSHLKDFLSGHSDQTSYANAGQALGLSPDAAKMAAHRLRTRYRQLLRNEIARTVECPEDVADELNRLFRIFSD